MPIVRVGAVAPAAYEFVVSSAAIGGLDLETVTAAILHVRDRDGAVSEWEVDELTYDAETQRLTLLHEFVEGDISDKPGKWSVYAELAVPHRTTTIAAGSNGASLPQGTIHVDSAAAFASRGRVRVTTDAGVQEIAYTGKTGTSLTGCSGGTGAMATGGAVVQGTLDTEARQLEVVGRFAVLP